MIKGTYDAVTHGRGFDRYPKRTLIGSSTVHYYMRTVNGTRYRHWWFAEYRCYHRGHAYAQQYTIAARGHNVLSTIIGIRGANG